MSGPAAEDEGAGERRRQLIEVFREAESCERCPLHETRTRVVFGAGDADADLIFVGEAPGADEDRRGLPFVGRAGQLLNQLLEDVGLSRERVFITNVLKSRPPGNRDPKPEEIEACRPFLYRQIELIEPKVLATLGNFSTKLLTGDPTGITRVRGIPQTHKLGARTVRIFPLLHPAAALRTPKMRETLAADFETLRELLEQPGPEQEPTPTPDPAPPPAQKSGAPLKGTAPASAETEQLDIFRPR